MINQRYNELLMTLANTMMTKNIRESELREEVERLKKKLKEAERKNNGKSL